MSSCHLTSAALLHQPLERSQDRNLPVEFFASGGTPGQGHWALLGESVAVRRLRLQISRVAPYFRTALIRGESGSGKEFVARAIHALSPGATGPFIVADARLLAESASDLQSTNCAAGAIESAHGGTLYVTSVEELLLGHQAMLTRFLRASEVRQDDSRNPRTRVLAASEHDLRTLQFDKDLCTRLTGVEILVPPLRQRVDDIPTLVEWLLRHPGGDNGRCPKVFAESAMTWLQEHAWPKNLRELERVVLQAALAQDEVIETRHLLALVEPELAGTTTVTSERLHDVIQRHVLEVLTRCGGNKVRAAELLGISRSTLYRMLEAR